MLVRSFEDGDAGAGCQTAADNDRGGGQEDEEARCSQQAGLCYCQTGA